MKRFMSWFLIMMFVGFTSLFGAPVLYAGEHGGESTVEHGGTAVTGEEGEEEENKVVSEDTNENGILDPGEDLNDNGELDTELEVDAEGKPVAPVAEEEAKEHGGKEHGGQ